MPDETQEREPDGVRWAREVVDDDAPVYATQVSDMREILAHIDRLTRELREERERVRHWMDKAAAYGGIVHASTPALARAGHPIANGSTARSIADAVDALARERDEAQARADNAASLLEASTRSGVLAVAMQENETLRARLARFEALAREAKRIDTNDRSPRADGLRHNLTNRLAALASPPAPVAPTDATLEE